MSHYHKSLNWTGMVISCGDLKLITAGVVYRVFCLNQPSTYTNQMVTYWYKKVTSEVTAVIGRVTMVFTLCKVNQPNTTNQT